jgi:hypothetical protein
MRLPKNAAYLLAIIAVSLAFSALPRSSHAQEFATIPTTYKVQVEYWYFDSDYSYWSTVLETNNQAEAELMYELLLTTQEDGQLNALVPNFNWRYIAVDVRLSIDSGYARYATLTPMTLQPINRTRSKAK